MKAAVYPTLLSAGDKAALIAPSSPTSKDVLKAARLSLEAIGLRPVTMSSCTGSDGYLAGSDALRAENINSAFEARDIKGIFCLRGGYGSARLLPMIDYELIHKNPKVFVGYSDITALHNAINSLCGLITFHGPMPAEDYRCLDSFALASLKSRIFSQGSRDTHGLRADTYIENPPGHLMHTAFPGKASGLLTGGNLSVTASTLGSPYEVDTRGKIFFLEDTGEEPYRLDRALISLNLAGKFKDCSGIILGSFSDFHGSIGDRKVFEKNLLYLIQKHKKPTLVNLKAGHIPNQITLPLGSYVTLEAQSEGISNISVRNQSHVLY